MSRPGTIAGVAGALLLGAAQAQSVPEAQLQKVIDAVREGRLGAALGEADRLVSQYPNFRLAHLVRGDVLLARVRPIDRIGNTGHALPERLRELRAEAAARLRASNEPPPSGRVPRAFLQLAPGERHGLLVDADASRVYVFENADGTPRLVRSFYATLGRNGVEKAREGDRKTPVGVYEVTTHIPGSRLPDLYGWGAFALSYPNEWDRREGRTGYGIWLHGVPADTYARAPKASDGCIALANPEIEALALRMQPGATPVVIARRAEWVMPEALSAEREDFLRRLERWRADWESGRTGRYLAHYAREFRSRGIGLAEWGARKRRTNTAKSWIKVVLENVSLYRDPGRRDMIVATFDQDYRSSNFAGRARKRQYWIREEDTWKIAHESEVGAPRLLVPESFPAGPAAPPLGSRTGFDVHQRETGKR